MCFSQKWLRNTRISLVFLKNDRETPVSQVLFSMQEPLIMKGLKLIQFIGFLILFRRVDALHLCDLL